MTPHKPTCVHCGAKATDVVRPGDDYEPVWMCKTHARLAREEQND